ncbi:MAG: hypothetical protein K2K68_01710 [Duncaniella sp.]|nr:hypothetical protein [Duncaniella sp.]MDE6581752.1 hypothetical protein [Duncaniella sp.]
MKLFKILFPAIIALTMAVAPLSIAAQNITAGELSAKVNDLSTEQIVSMAQTLLDTPIAGNEETVKAYSTIILMWLTNTDEMTISMNAIPELSTNANILFAYLSAEIINMNKLGLKTNDKTTFIKSMKDVLKYYLVNKDAIGRIPELSKLSRTPANELDRKLGKMYKASMH